MSMKTAEIWLNEQPVGCSVECEQSSEDVLEWIKQIQLDAIKQGYKEAAGITSLWLTKNRLHPDFPNEKLSGAAKIASHSALQQATDAILTAMNERKIE